MMLLVFGPSLNQLKSVGVCVGLVVEYSNRIVVTFGIEHDPLASILLTRGDESTSVWHLLLCSFVFSLMTSLHGSVQNINEPYACPDEPFG